MKELISTRDEGVSQKTVLQIGNACIKFNKIARIISFIIMGYLPIIILSWNHVEFCQKLVFVSTFLCVGFFWFLVKRKSNLLKLHYDLQTWMLDCFECNHKFNHYIHTNDIKTKNPD